MNLNVSQAIDAQASIREHEAAAGAEAHQAAVDPIATPDSTVAGHETSPSERLYEAYRLWCLSGR